MTSLRPQYTTNFKTNKKERIEYRMHKVFKERITRGLTVFEPRNSLEYLLEILYVI